MLTLTFSASSEDVEIKCKPTTKFSKLRLIYATQQGVDLARLKFQYNGEPLSKEQTPEELGIKDDAVIHVLDVISAPDITDADDFKLIDKPNKSAKDNPDLAATLAEGLSSDKAAATLVSTLRSDSQTGAAVTTLKHLNDLEPEAVVAADGVQSLVDALRAADMPDAEHKACFEQGCFLLMSITGAALDGSRSCAEALTRAKATSAVVTALARHPARAAIELGEAAAGALMQLACVDVSSALADGLATATVGLIEAPDAGGWLLFLCARTLSWCACTGGADALSVLRKAGCVPALLHIVKRARVLDSTCGEPFGVADALEQLEIEARKALALLVGAPIAESSSRATPASSTVDGLDVGLYVLRDRAVVHGLVSKSVLNGAAGVIVEVGEPGCGPNSASGRYGVRLELPESVRGTGVKVKPVNLRLAPRKLARQIDELDPGSAPTTSPLPAHLDSKFGKLNVRVIEPGA